MMCQKSFRSIDDIFQFFLKVMPDLRMKIIKFDLQKISDTDAVDVANCDDQFISVNLPGSNLDKYIRRCLISFR